jgi:two-component system chemotaxis sensor kinase CheA
MSLDQATLTFREEALELLGEVEEILLTLEDHPEDTGQVAKLFRAMHTIKGSGAMFGFNEIARFTHEVETALDMVRDGRLPFSRDLASLILVSRDHILRLLGKTGANPRLIGESDKLIRGLQEITGQAGEMAPASCSENEPGIGTDHPHGADSPPFTWWIRYRPHPDSFLTGTDPLSLVIELTEMGPHRVVVHNDAVPDLTSQAPESVVVWWDVLLISDAREADIRSVFMFVEEDHTVHVACLAGSALRQHDLDKFQQLLASSGLDDTEELKQKMACHVADVLSHRTPPSPCPAEVEKTEPAITATTIRVESTRLDRLVDFVGEMVIIQSRLQQTALTRDDSLIRTIAEELDRVVSKMRDETLRIRMVPIGGMFGTLRRLVRDLARDLDKQAEFVAEGGETELDKNVIDRLKDPLVHILRNCVDHGLESPEARLAAGKPTQGTVRLVASHVSGEVHIEINDDGGGVNLERVRAKAEGKGLLAPGEPADNQRILDCLFAPGFSTASQVSNVSGRGVGLDVVKVSIEGLRGRVRLESTPGAGTRIIMRLPLTLAIIDGMQVRVGRERYIIPLTAVRACQERQCLGEAVPVDTISWQGQMTPCLSLRALLGVTGERPPYERIIIARAEGGDIGLAVDAVIGEQQAVIKRLSDMYRNVDFISGTAVNGDGGIALILDVPRLTRYAMAHHGNSGVSQGANQTTPQP